MRVATIGRPVALLLTGLLVAPPAFARTVRCESPSYRYHYCSVRTYGDVHLERELSFRSCQHGRGWGYDQRGIWVDRGCRADFEVDDGHRGSYSGYDYDDDHDHDHGSKGTAVAGVVLGAAIAAAIIASKNRSRTDDRDVVPNWLVGRFEGYNTQQHADVALQISPSGSVTGVLPGGEQVEGTYSNGHISMTGVEFDVAQTGSGFTLTQRDDALNVTVYHRDR